MTPDQAVTLLSGDWPPRVQHWPPKDGDLREGASLVGRIEAVMTLPRPDGSKHRGEPYTALYIRREGDGRLIMWHGWHTAAEDLDGMHPRPGLLFACVYRGQRDDGFKFFRFLITPYDEPAERQAAAAEAPGVGQQQQPSEAERPTSECQPSQPQARPAPGTAAQQVGGITDNGRPTEAAIDFISRLPHDAEGLAEARELLLGTTTDYKHLVKAAAERHYESEEGYRQMWNDTDLAIWAAVLHRANQQAAQLLDGREAGRGGQREPRPRRHRGRVRAGHAGAVALGRRDAGRGAARRCHRRFSGRCCWQQERRPHRGCPVLGAATPRPP
jgi:hypothetical protein